MKQLHFIPAQDPCNPFGTDDPPPGSTHSQCWWSWHPTRAKLLSVDQIEKDKDAHAAYSAIHIHRISCPPQAPM